MYIGMYVCISMGKGPGGAVKCECGLYARKVRAKMNFVSALMQVENAGMQRCWDAGMQ